MLLKHMSLFKSDITCDKYGLIILNCIKEKRGEVMTRNELFRVSSCGGYCDHRSGGPGCVTRDLP